MERVFFVMSVLVDQQVSTTKSTEYTSCINTIARREFWWEGDCDSFDRFPSWVDSSKGAGKVASGFPWRRDSKWCWAQALLMIKEFQKVFKSLRVQ